MTTSTRTDREVVARRASTAAAVGTAIEYYDFAIYGSLAVVLAKLFFPATQGFVALLSTLGVIAGAYVIRPLGGLIFGRIGDRRGRRTVLLATVALMGIATALTGLLPTYASIGVAAPVLLTLLRLLQGLSAGGEVGGAVSLSTESAPSKRRGLFGSSTSIGVAIGLAGAAAVVGTVSALTTAEQMASWGWRIPFLIAAPLLVAAVIYRLKVEDSPLFLKMVEESAPPKAPLTEVVRDHKGSLLRIIGLAYSTLTTGALASVYLVVHLSGVLKYSLSSSLWLTVLIILVPMGLIPWAGALSDRFGRKRVAATGMIGFVVLSVPCFWLMQQNSLLLAIIAALVLNVPFAIQQGVVYTMYAEQFPTRVRYSGVSLGFNLGGIIGTGTASLVAASLVAATGVTIAPAFYAVFAAVVGLLMLLTITESAGKRLVNGTPSEEDGPAPVPAPAER
ncbi:MFS transporter [Actinomycetospora sp. NBRC 106378]|uniref:MFS transporter n=1 Tax=Actinomycetospora sp. NBRC 106378 TaxID=3032208 RepID=UPI0024A1E85B|nr:MFS transporter [Actinomycetospora sp. NBRC 106378]GLZ52559.1 MFS transporter [Actinomycetospora sp. NBRC 106378]